MPYGFLVPRYAAHEQSLTILLSRMISNSCQASMALCRVVDHHVFNEEKDCCLRLANSPCNYGGV